MFCQNCGKENVTGGKFCGYCGQALNVNSGSPTNIYKYRRQQTEAESKMYLERQKADRIKKRVKVRTEMSSVMWLIWAVILFVVLIINIRTIPWGYALKTDNTFTFILDRVWKNILPNVGFPFKISSLLIHLIWIITGIVGIINFCRYRKSKPIYLYNKYAKAMLAVQCTACIVAVVICLTDILFSDTLWKLMGIFKIYIILEGVSKYHFDFINRISCVLILIMALPVFASLSDVVNEAVVKKHSEIFESESENAPKKRNILFAVTMILMVCLAAGSALISMWGIYCDVRYEREQERIINEIKCGYLDYYEDENIEDIVNEVADREECEDVFWHYDSEDPQRGERYFNVPEKRYRYIAADMRSHKYEKTREIQIRFYLNTINNHIAVYKINNGDEEITGSECIAWLGTDTELFGKSEYDRGVGYMKNGIYASDEVTLYERPDYRSDSGYTFAYSGVKDVWDFSVEKSYGETMLWLEVEINDGDETELYWIPEQ